MLHSSCCNTLQHAPSQQGPLSSSGGTAECSLGNFGTSRRGNELQAMSELLPHWPHCMAIARRECGVYGPDAAQCELFVPHILSGLFDDTLLLRCGAPALPTIHKESSS
jgi:hypothetical protein